MKLEFGSLTDQRPTGRHPVKPWLAESVPQAFDDWSCEVVALELERSFWEKATILHVESHRPAEKPTPDRFSRHYADTAALAKLDVATKAIGNEACETASSNGRASSSATHGLGMTWPGPAALGWCRLMSECKRCVSTIKRCAKCISRNPLSSIRFWTHWASWKAELTRGVQHESAFSVLGGRVARPCRCSH